MYIAGLSQPFTISYHLPSPTLSIKTSHVAPPGLPLLHQLCIAPQYNSWRSQARNSWDVCKTVLGNLKKKDWVKTSRCLAILATFPKFFLICFEVENQEFRHSHLDTGYKGKNAEVKDMQPWYSETTKSSLARLFSDSPMETQDSICHLFVISYGSAHSNRTRH